MKKLFPYLITLLTGLSAVAYGQLSPGKLTSAHADLEGVGNCTLCHDLGASSKVSDTKCLDCHVEIESLLDQNRGYHASSQVKGKTCFSCHSEHHGRKFDMVRFDQNNFNHDFTGYPLDGAHARIDCKACHTPEYIADPDIRKLEGTFLGLEQACLSCHEDYHQNTLSNDCILCHNVEAFSPVLSFDHDDTEFPLKGEHKSVECIDCHAVTTRNGKSFQEFSNIPFASCVDCHDDPHESQIPGACTQCHDENSFTRFLGQRRFNHNRTDFSLKGSHKEVSCFECHAKTSNPRSVFQDQDNIPEDNCIACHEDVHEGSYGEDCAKCHNEESFLSLNNMDFFDHSVTDYPLEGMHHEVDCRACHEERFSTPIDFSACKNCHEDYHNGEFVQDNPSSDCIDCHSLEVGFEETLYTIEQHASSDFPLVGAHIATPCFACHLSEDNERWTFRNIGSACVDCHEDIHEGFISEQYYPETDCEACHSSDSWASIAFDHDLTGWALDGKHAEVDCRDCHFEFIEGQSAYTQVFANLDNACVSCHENVHGDEFAIDGVTTCTRCHVTTSWVPEKFDHSQTAFPLEGRHAEIDCRACHEVALEDGSTEIVYKIEKFECIDCHQ